MAADTLTIAAGLKAMGVDAQACKTVQQAKALADEFVVANTMPSDRIKLAVMALDYHPNQNHSSQESGKEAAFSRSSTMLHMRPTS